MAPGPTIGASERSSTGWARRPVVARAIRILAFVAPAALAWLVTAQVSRFFWRPAGTPGIVLYVAQLAITGIATVAVAGRLTRRLLPLATLLDLAVIFPDQSPSRFRSALRGGSMRNLQAQVDRFRGDKGEDINATVTQIIEMIGALSRHERLTRGHTERVRAYADLIAQEMGLDDEERHLLQWSCMVHDIGKLAVPAEILNKAGRPTDEEWKILSSHPAVGGELVEPLAPWLGEWRLAAAEHHERWDGTGYPRGLAGTDISLAGRIVAVADAYDVITSHRSYKKPMSAEAARAELVRCSGTQFDPAVVRAMLNASLGKRSVTASSIGWLGQLQGLASAGASGAATAAGNVAAAAAVVGTVALGGVPTPTPAPEAAAPLVESTSAPLPEPAAARVEPATSTSTSTSTAPPATTTTEADAVTQRPIVAAPPASPTTTTTTTTPHDTTSSAGGTTTTTTAPLPATPPAAEPAAEPVGCRTARTGGTSLRGDDLSACDFTGAALRNLDLSQTDLREADLAGATISLTSLLSADLRGADLRGATLEDLDLIDADLRGADLRGATIRRANLRGIDLRGALLDGTTFEHVDLAGADFTGAPGTPVNGGFIGWLDTRCVDGTRSSTGCF